MNPSLLRRIQFWTLFVSVSPVFFFVNCSSAAERFSRLSLGQSEIVSQTFSKPRAMLNKTRKTSFLWLHPCNRTLIDHGQRPITAHVKFTSLYKPESVTLSVSVNINTNVNSMFIVSVSLSLSFKLTLTLTSTLKTLTFTFTFTFCYQYRYRYRCHYHYQYQHYHNHSHYR